MIGDSITRKTVNKRDSVHVVVTENQSKGVVEEKPIKSFGSKRFDKIHPVVPD